MGVEITYNHADYRLMSKRAIDALAEFKEVNLFLRGLVPMVGFKSDIVKYVRNECNLGMFGNMNQGVAISETDYLCFLHDDDLYSPYFVEKVMHTIDSKKYKAFHIGISKFANGEEIIPQLIKDGIIASRESFRSNNSAIS